ncbi:MAG: PBSX family phage terminase large subunit [Oscillospiraceae bacterium]|nr:PBSX family phage terminase large subunit [Oscillospiraceae bacterium]
MKDLLSKRQRECLEYLKSGGLKRINILEGSVRSGKTYISLLLWGFWIVTKEASCTFMMAGKTLTTLKRNVLEPLADIFGAESFNYSTGKKEASLFGRRIYLEGVSDSRSEGKIRGLTLDGAYCDELSLFEEDFFKMLLSRLSKHGAKLFATTNPDHPNHWLKRDYLDNRELDLLDVKFTLDDNIHLDKKYVESLKKEYKGMYYERFILGLWVAAEGRIYSEFDKGGAVLSEVELHRRLEYNPPLFTVVGVDFGGNRSASVFSLVGFDKGFKNVYLLREYYDKENKSAESLIEAFTEKISEWREEFPPLKAVYCDSAEQLLVKSFRHAVPVEVKNALKRPVNQRVAMLCRLISAGRFFVNSSCVKFIESMETAVWDSGRAGVASKSESASKPGKDVRLDDGSVNIDSLDGFEYAIERYERELFKF